MGEPIEIHVASGVGVGRTALAAFDSALHRAGVANYNLIRLSSVIPPMSKIALHQDAIPPGTLGGSWGDRLYLVIAERRADTPNEEAWAGIGWIQGHETGRGLFVEHEGNSEHKVRHDIEKSLEGLAAIRDVDFSDVEMSVVGITCTDHPVCAVVVAAYKVVGWNGTRDELT